MPKYADCIVLMGWSLLPNTLRPFQDLLCSNMLIIPSSGKWTWHQQLVGCLALKFLLCREIIIKCEDLLKYDWTKKGVNIFMAESRWCVAYIYNNYQVFTLVEILQKVVTDVWISHPTQCSSGCILQSTTQKSPLKAFFFHDGVETRGWTPTVLELVLVDGVVTAVQQKPFTFLSHKNNGLQNIPIFTPYNFVGVTDYITDVVTLIWWHRLSVCQFYFFV